MTPAELEDYWEHLAARARANQLPIPEGYDKRAIPLGMYKIQYLGLETADGYCEQHIGRPQT